MAYPPAASARRPSMRVASNAPAAAVKEEDEEDEDSAVAAPAAAGPDDDALSAKLGSIGLALAALTAPVELTADPALASAVFSATARNFDTRSLMSASDTAEDECRGRRDRPWGRVHVPPPRVIEEGNADDEATLDAARAPVYTSSPRPVRSCDEIA
jgi:hypothetical protein